VPTIDPNVDPEEFAVADFEKPSPAADLVRNLTADGRLVSYFREASDSERRRLRAGAAEIVGPLVFLRVTRPVERGRGHRRCASGVQRLAPECLDRFHDDTDAVLDYLFGHADVPIANLEGWLSVRLQKATVDAHRRRRGQRGAPQRPRVPAWLAGALGHDPWLVELAKAILDWVGVETTAGLSLWPVTAWTELRSAVTGDHIVGEATVAAEIEVVLTAMRRRPTWYEKTIERPLGRKQAPVWFPSHGTADGYAEPLALVAPHERDEALLTELAALAIDVMARRIDDGEEPVQVVREVLGTVFGALPASHHLDRSPGDNPAGPELAAALISDPARLERIVATVVDLFRGRG
jgi:hypothetical protein